MYKILKYLGVVYIVAAIITGFYLFSISGEFNSSVIIVAGIGVIVQGLIVGLIAICVSNYAEMLEDIDNKLFDLKVIGKDARNLILGKLNNK